MDGGRTLGVICRRYDTTLTVYGQQATRLIEHNTGPLHACRDVVDDLREMLILHQPTNVDIRVESDSMAAGLTAGAAIGACHRDLLMRGVHIGVTYSERTLCE